ncbi:hypothetical protein GOARA_061_01390 [Gordonia araii NBRC 100433]|uniref:Low molecular weight protein antigen 6 PH domain-containing protein n=1 Tax=Gordonia araii NBRC 100433 TaxID=1073574 RepID=G7H4C4_9ACTN|nr:PH domain-containing protein [Gordonia araii]GAB10699.1 hypothetical protein GOARA_061_01390 [Gordonia araii NBRC 100433]
MADSDSPATPHSDGDSAEPLVIRLSGVAYLATIGVLVIALIFAGIDLRYFGWVLLAPVVLILWIRRLRTVVDDDGLTAVRTFRTDRVAWDDLAGLQFPKWSATRAVTTLGDRVPLPAVGFTDLPAIAERSGGRVPDPFAAEEQARNAEDD